MRRTGWTLRCAAIGSDEQVSQLPHPGAYPLLLDATGFSTPLVTRLVARLRPARRVIVLGVADAGERARLIAQGAADALGSTLALAELDARAHRVREQLTWLPRRREAGPLMLDLVQRDGRLGNRWLGLHPREFSLAWRLAERPGARVTRRQLLHDVWRLDYEPETNSLEVHVSRLRAKLARLGGAGLLETVPAGGYRLTASLPQIPVSRRAPAHPGNSLPRHQELVAG